MAAIEITLIIIGIVLVFSSFFISEKISSADLEKLAGYTKEELHRMVETELKDSDQRIRDTIEAQIDMSVEKTDREWEKVSNEKIMAINEFSESVMESIQKNHSEVMFLYSMLTEKEEELKKEILEAQQLEQALRKEIYDENALRTASVQKATEKQEPAESVIPTQNAYRSKERKEETPQTQQTIAPESGMRQMFMMRDMIDAQQIPAVNEPTVMHKEPVEEEVMSLQEMAAQETATQEMAATETVAQETVAQETAVPIRQQVVPPTPAPVVRTEEYAENVRNNDDRNKEILRLHREGLSNVEIAKKLNLGQGEVKLVIGLYEGIRR